MKKLISIIGLAIFFISCASYRPIIDVKGTDLSNYESDLAECQAYARQIDPASNAVVSGAVGAGLGALFGAVVGSAFGVNPGNLAGSGAAVGGLAGATSGAANSMTSQQEIIKNCMRGRGYKVLQ